eukprot:gene20947-biopygen7088
MSGVGAPAITAPHPPGGDDPLAAVFFPGLGPRLYGPEPPPEAN